MTRTPKPGRPGRFQGTLRHYHRSGAKPQDRWDSWIDGGVSARPGRNSSSRWIVIAAALAAIGGLAAYLVVAGVL